MNTMVASSLLLLFLAHLAGFSWLGLKRRQWYYLALVLTFALLSTSFALVLAAPDWRWAGQPVHGWVRYAAWASAAVSITWTVMRALGRGRRGD